MRLRTHTGAADVYSWAYLEPDLLHFGQAELCAINQLREAMSTSLALACDSTSAPASALLSGLEGNGSGTRQAGAARGGSSGVSPIERLEVVGRARELWSRRGRTIVGCLLQLYLSEPSSAHLVGELLDFPFGSTTS